MRHKMTMDEHEMPTPAAKAAYTISRCKGKAAGHLEPALKARTYDEDPEGLMAFLKDSFDDTHRKLRAEGSFRRLYMRKGESFKDFYLKFTELAAESKLPKSLYKSELGRKITYELYKSATREFIDESVSYEQFQKVVTRLAFIKESVAARAAIQDKKNLQPSKPGMKSTRPTGETRAEQPTGKPQSPVKCYNCKGFGHIARECLARDAVAAAHGAGSGSETESEN